MGYRIYLGTLSHKTKEHIKNVSSYKELYTKLKEVNHPLKYDDEPHVGVYEIVEDTIHEFGKYIEWTEELQRKCTKQVFLNKEFNKEVNEEHDFFIINKDGLVMIMDEYAQDMRSFYEEKWALSQLQYILTIAEEGKDGLKEDWKKIRDTILKPGSYLKYDYEDIFEIPLSEIAAEKNKKEVTSIIRKIAGDFQGYFRGEMGEYHSYRGKNQNITDLREERPYNITTSWKKDKGILELAHIFKTFDWENGDLIIYGY